MKLLIVTQKVDMNDDILGFFHRWIEEFSKRFEKVTVICLEKGSYQLPENVEVFSLGKENGRSRFKYLVRFYGYVWSLRREYDVVFVHMNQEYAVLGGLVWRMLGKKIGLWRNHPIGTLMTRVAARFSHILFCTSPFAYIAPLAKTSLMPVGIDTEEFRPIGGARVPDSLVFFGRLAPIKKPEVLIEALALLKKKNALALKTTFIGNARVSDSAFFRDIKEKIEADGLTDYISFHNAVPHHEAPAILSRFEACVNATPSGSMDKTIFEAMACETIPLVSNRALRGDIPDFLLFEEGNSESLSRSIWELFFLSATERRDLGEKLRRYVIDNHSLSTLMDKIQNKFAVSRN